MCNPRKKMQRQDQFFVITIFLVVIFSIFHSGDALQCYLSLGVDKSSKEEITCNIPNAVCVTYTIADPLGRSKTVRDCVVREFCEIMKDWTVVQDCKECSTDLCNASATNAVSTIIMIISGLITLFWTIQ